MIDREYLKVNTSIQTASNKDTLLHDEEDNLEATIELRLPDSLFEAKSAGRKIDSVTMLPTKFRLSMENTPITQIPIDTEKTTDTAIISKCQLDVYPYCYLDDGQIKPTPSATSAYETALPNYKNHVVIYNIYAYLDSEDATEVENYNVVANTDHFGFPRDSVYYNLAKQVGALGIESHLMNMCVQGNRQRRSVEGGSLMLDEIGVLEQLFQDALENAITFASTGDRHYCHIYLTTANTTKYASANPDIFVDVTIAGQEYRLYYIEYKIDPEGTVPILQNGLLRAFKPRVRIGEQALTIEYDSAAFDQIVPVLWNSGYVDTYDRPEQMRLDQFRNSVWAAPPPKRVYKFDVDINESLEYVYKLMESVTCRVMNIIGNKAMRDTFSFLPWITIDTNTIPAFGSTDMLGYRSRVTSVTATEVEGEETDRKIIHASNNVDAISGTGYSTTRYRVKFITRNRESAYDPSSWDAVVFDVGTLSSSTLPSKILVSESSDPYQNTTRSEPQISYSYDYLNPGQRVIESAWTPFSRTVSSQNIESTRVIFHDYTSSTHTDTHWYDGITTENNNRIVWSNDPSLTGMTYFAIPEREPDSTYFSENEYQGDPRYLGIYGAAQRNEDCVRHDSLRVATKPAGYPMKTWYVRDNVQNILHLSCFFHFRGGGELNRDSNNNIIDIAGLKPYMMNRNLKKTITRIMSPLDQHVTTGWTLDYPVLDVEIYTNGSKTLPNGDYVRTEDLKYQNCSIEPGPANQPANTYYYQADGSSDPEQTTPHTDFAEEQMYFILLDNYTTSDQRYRIYDPSTRNWLDGAVGTHNEDPFRFPGDYAYACMTNKEMEWFNFEFSASPTITGPIPSIPPPWELNDVLITAGSYAGSISAIYYPENDEVEVTCRWILHNQNVATGVYSAGNNICYLRTDYVPGTETVTYSYNYYDTYNVHGYQYLYVLAPIGNETIWYGDYTWQLPNAVDGVKFIYNDTNIANVFEYRTTDVGRRRTVETITTELINTDMTSAIVPNINLDNGKFYMLDGTSAEVSLSQQQLIEVKPPPESTEYAYKEQTVVAVTNKMTKTVINGVFYYGTSGNYNSDITETIKTVAGEETIFVPFEVGEFYLYSFVSDTQEHWPSVRTEQYAEYGNTVQSYDTTIPPYFESPTDPTVIRYPDETTVNPATYTDSPSYPPGEYTSDPTITRTVTFTNASPESHPGMMFVTLRDSHDQDLEVRLSSGEEDWTWDSSSQIERFPAIDPETQSGYINMYSVQAVTGGYKHDILFKMARYKQIRTLNPYTRRERGEYTTVTEQTETTTTTVTKMDPAEYVGNIRLSFTWNNLPMVVLSPIASIVMTLMGMQVNPEMQPINATEESGTSSALTTSIPIVENYYSLASTLRDLHDELVVVKESFDDRPTYTLATRAGQERVLKLSAKYITKDGKLHQIFIPPNGVFSVQLTFAISFFST